MSDEVMSTAMSGTVHGEGRRKFNFWAKIAGGLALVAGVGLAFTFEKPITSSVQQGFRGIGMAQINNRPAVAAKNAANQAPEAQPAVDPAGQPSREVYQNVQVLGDVDANEFIRIMGAITEWVSPVQGCAYCHKEGEELSADTLYTKRVARRMLQMTQHINTAWQSHVGTTGVTCYTCHRGQNVPQNIWFTAATPQAGRMVGDSQGQNQPATAVGLASLPYDPFTPYLASNPKEIRVDTRTALPSGNPATIKATEQTYSLMIHMSESLGVNCTFCHNSRAFFDWQQSSPQRTTAWHGIRMTRDVVDNYLTPLKPEYPPIRLGPLGDAPKANCATCHQGVSKPLLGAKMIEAYPALAREAAAQPPKPPGQ